MALPSGVIHGDLFPDNVLFQGEHITGIIDFYFACTDLLAYDLAICLNSWCFEPDGHFNSDKSAAILANYQLVRPLSAQEQDALPILTQGAAARFFATRYYDWHHTSDTALVSRHDPMEYWQKLQFQQTISDPSFYGL